MSDRRAVRRPVPGGLHSSSRHGIDRRSTTATARSAWVSALAALRGPHRRSSLLGRVLIPVGPPQGTCAGMHQPGSPLERCSGSHSIESPCPGIDQGTSCLRRWRLPGQDEDLRGRGEAVVPLGESLDRPGCLSRVAVVGNLKSYIDSCFYQPCRALPVPGIVRDGVCGYRATAAPLCRLTTIGEKLFS